MHQTQKEIMTLSEIIFMVTELDEDDVIFAKKIKGKFEPNSEAICLNLPEEERELPIAQTAEKYCVGFDYFLEVFLMKEMIDDMSNRSEYDIPETRVETLLHYVEFDA